MPPLQSDELNENTLEAIRVEDLTVEGDLQRIAEVNQAIREGRCKISRLDNNHNSGYLRDKESELDLPSS